MPIGVEIQETTNTPSAIVAPPTAVIALIGTAPIGDVNVLTLLQSANADSVFGLEVQGFTIPKALTAIRRQAPNAKVLVVNVADETYGTAQTNVSVTNEAKVLTGTTPVNLAFAPEGSAPNYGLVVTDTAGTTTYAQGTDYTISAAGVLTRVGGGTITSGQTVHVDYVHLPNHTVTANKITLDDVPYRSSPVVVYNTSKTTTYVEGTDYELSQFGVITRLNTGAITSAQVLLVSYDTFDGISASDVLGTATPRTGLYLYEEAFSTFGFEPTIWDCPVHISASGVLGAIRSLATNTYGGIVLLDAPSGLTVAQVETARGAGSGNILDVSDQRVICLYPQPYVYDVASDDVELRPLSSFIAGFFAKVDTEDSPARTLGNYPSAVLGIESLETELTWDPSYNRTTDCSRLFDAEVLTLKPGFFPWGTKSSAYRDSTNILGNYNVRRVADIIKRSLEVGAAQFIGMNITQALIDAIRQNAQAFLDDIAQQGWIVRGKAIFNISDNSDSQIALGHLTFAVEVEVQIAVERLTYIVNYTTPSLLAA